MDRFRRMWRLGRELISLYIYKKDLHFFEYYLKILIRMAIMSHTRAKTELRHGRSNLLQSVINTAKQLGNCNHLSSWCGRKSKLDKQDRHVPCVLLDIAFISHTACSLTKRHLQCGARRGNCFQRHYFSFFFSIFSPRNLTKDKTRQYFYLESGS